MSRLGELLEARKDVLVARWLDRVRLEAASDGLSTAELRDHVPLFVREICDALHGGLAPSSSNAAKEHGRQREGLGFDVEAVVREYGLLLDVILDLAEAEGFAPTIADARIVTRFVSLGINESVAAHRRHQDRISLTHDADASARAAEVKALVDALPVLVAFVGADGRYGLVNRAYQEWFGLGPDELRGRTVESVIGAAAWTQLGPHVARALAGERFSFEQHAVPYGSAGTRDVAVTFIPRHGLAGELEGYVALVEDITARRRLAYEREQLLVAERDALRDADVQRAHLRSLVANAPIGIATWRGPDHVFESANGFYLDLLQRTPQILGQSLVSAFPELPPAHPVHAIFDDVYRTGDPFVDPEYRVTLTLDGQAQAKVLVFHLTAVRGAENTIDGLMACISDVTEIVRLRELIEVERDLATAVAELETSARLASDEARGRTEFLLKVASALGESLDLAVVLQRLVAIVAPSNALVAGVWSAFAGAPVRRIVHAPATPLLQEETTPLTSGREAAVALPVERAIATGETFRVDDYASWMLAHGAPEASRAGASLGLGEVLYIPIRRGAEVVAVLSVGGAKEKVFAREDVVVLESIARLAALAFENARLYGEMAAFRRAAEEATVAKDHFLAHVSHDLRNPLSSILGWTTLLRELEGLPAQAKRGLDVIERNAKSQVQLIEDLLDVSRIASGKLTLVMAVEDVHSAIDTALDAARLAAAAKKVQLVVLVDRDIGAIAVDPDRFRQIVWNLVANAVKFTATGGTVRVEAKRVGTVFQLDVSDDGRGIAPAFLPRVFGAFEQAEAVTQRSGGLGLGLAIVKKLVELHGGTIRVESDGEGRGSRFVVELPIRAALRPLDSVMPPGGRGALAGVRLLVVDDEEEARDVITVVLEQAGAIVTGASSVDDALDRFREAPPDAVVSDIAMPGRDGKDFVRELRTFPADLGGTVPVVALTAFVGRRDRQEILAAGFDAHVAKPVEPAELVGKLAELVGRKVAESARFS